MGQMSTAGTHKILIRHLQNLHWRYQMEFGHASNHRKNTRNYFQWWRRREEVTVVKWWQITGDKGPGQIMHPIFGYRLGFWVELFTQGRDLLPLNPSECSDEGRHRQVSYLQCLKCLLIYAILSALMTHFCVFHFGHSVHKCSVMWDREPTQVSCNINLFMSV